MSGLIEEMEKAGIEVLGNDDNFKEWEGELGP